MKITIYDNGGATLDRYTVIIGTGVYSMSINALSPQGVNQYCCETADLREPMVKERKVNPIDLPSEVRAAIGFRIVQH